MRIFISQSLFLQSGHWVGRGHSLDIKILKHQFPYFANFLLDLIIIEVHRAVYFKRFGEMIKYYIDKKVFY